jgi:hypothetical protein
MPRSSSSRSSSSPSLSRQSLARPPPPRPPPPRPLPLSRPPLPQPLPPKKSNILVDSLLSGIGFSFGNMMVKKLFEKPIPVLEEDNCSKIIENYNNNGELYDKYIKCMNLSTK